MSTPENSRSTLVYSLASIGGLVVLLVWMQGGFHSKVAPGNAQAAERMPIANGPTATVVKKSLDETLSWPGTVTARAVAQLAPKVTARILEIPVKTGDAVSAGQLLVRLDDRELQARVTQTKSALAAANAEASRAQADARRIQALFDKEAATRQTLDAAQAAAQAGNARVAEAKAAVAETESLLGESGLRAPFDGSVVARLLDPGDLAMPGAPVLTVQSSEKLRVETDVPAQCADLLKLGQSLAVRIGERQHQAALEEIAPASDPHSRTVHIKAALSGGDKVQPGSFASIDQACGRHDSLIVPGAAISRSGQLESVRLVVGGKVLLRHVRTGKVLNGDVEVLSGLNEGDVVQVGEGR
jgi:RND family efflux transporter MFP subunit